jgi:hypothetical protein
MSFPNNLDKEKLDELLVIIARNRWDRLRRRQEQLGAIEDDVQVENPEISPDSVRIVLFGTESPFIKSIIEMFRVITVIAYFDNPEGMITFCLDHPVKNILFDIDPPTDCHLAMDAFASIRMLLPNLSVFVCSGRKMSLEVDHFKMYGATVMEKPILRKQVKWFCETYCE